MNDYLAPSLQNYDLIVIGSGPGGQRAAVQAAKLKKKVLVIEKDTIGGSCLHFGTIPSKTLREAAVTNTRATVDDSTMTTAMARKERVVREEMGVIQQQLKRNGVECVMGRAILAGPKAVIVENSEKFRQTFEAEFIIIAAGTHPHHPEDVPFNADTVFDSDSILNLRQMPKAIAILGAGVIGCEYATIFARLGIHVTLLDRRRSMLRGVDSEVAGKLQSQFQEDHIELCLDWKMSAVKQITQANGRPGVEITIRDSQRQFDCLLFCLGRLGNMRPDELVGAGLVADERGIIKVNEHYQTNVPHIYAVGDIIGFPALAASSAEQGRLASAHAFKIEAGTFPATFPYGVYTIPELSWAGQNEDELRATQVPYVAGRAFYKELARGKILGDEQGFLKLLVHRETRKLLGVHVLGTGATELIHIGQVAMALGAQIEFFVNNVFNYPTLAEAYKVAAYNANNQLRS